MMVAWKRCGALPKKCGFPWWHPGKKGGFPVNELWLVLAPCGELHRTSRSVSEVWTFMRSYILKNCVYILQKQIYGVAWGY
ncbi:unnamed protein product [Callosobruchus maculatus]|uniref:Uncharacterized protein n=1 Tax=Callosobruchus maculatus TaxID=64391 RepID=A0A653CQK7_CALMS|nr:unnamed protein product [Callosobruchus maculatus]